MTSDLAIPVLACAAWLNRAQDRRLRFLLVQNRVLCEIGADHHRLTDAHRRALGEAVHDLSPDDLAACEPIVTVDTLRRYYREHYHRERPHAGLDGPVIESDPLLANRSGTVVRKDRLGGLLTMYHRVAA